MSTQPLLHESTSDAADLVLTSLPLEESPGISHIHYATLNWKSQAFLNYLKRHQLLWNVWNI